MAGMGGTVVRCHTCGVSVGNPLSFEPELNVFNENATAVIDVAVAAAAQHSIRLVVPLIDNYHYYHGGKHVFTDWRNLSNENDFYTNDTVIGDFENYIAHLLNHTNTLTGLAYKDDPTIMAWETGNELTPPVAWTARIASFIKGLAPHQLVLDGTSGVNPEALPLADVDIYTRHYYPMNPLQVMADAKQVSSSNKVYYVGEFGWAKGNLSAFIDALDVDGVAGDTYWSLFPHLDTYGFVQHGDSWTLHWPGDSDDMSARALQLRTHAFSRQGVAPPPAAAVPPAPLITSVVGNAIAWRGAAMAGNYSVQRSSAGQEWQTVCDACATDNSTPWRDTTQPSSGGVQYRVQGLSLKGVAGPWSPVWNVTVAQR